MALYTTTHRLLLVNLKLTNGKNIKIDIESYSGLTFVTTFNQNVSCLFGQ